MKRFLFLLILILSMAAVSATCEKTKGGDDCIDRKKIDPNAVCIEIYEPVCGCDGKTYPNSCYAAKAGVTKWTPGECPQ